MIAAGAGRDVRLTWGEWGELSARVARALLRDGVEPGSAVAVFAGNRNIWPIADVGVLMAGAVSVAADPASTSAQLARQLGDCGAVAAFVDTTERLTRLVEARGELPALQLIVCEDGPSNGARWWGEWLGDAMAEGAPLPSPSPDDVALLFYDSHAAAEPKGARITHRCISASVAAFRETLGVGELDRSLSVIPYSDPGERMFGLYARILCGTAAAHAEDARRLCNAAIAFEPTLIRALPADFEGVHAALLRHEGALGGEALALWQATVALGRERSALRNRGSPVPDLLEARWRVGAASCRSEIARLLGSNVRLAMSGAGPLAVEAAEYLDAVGLPVFCWYGVPEHLCIAMHRPDAHDSLTVGPPMPGTEVRLAADGELLVRRSASTFAGYHARPEASRRAFTEDGVWLKTGSRASITKGGRLKMERR